MDVVSVPLFILLLFLSSRCRSDDQLTQAKPLSPGDMLVSKGKTFALGFFSPTNTSNTSRLYIGIWYYSLPVPERTVVWVANRDNPITTPSSSKSKLAITNNSKLVLSDFQGRTLWTTAASNITAGGAGAGAVAVLLDSGNFVIRLRNGTDIIWQSFDHPTDTMLPTMRFLLSNKTQVVGRLVAWKGPDDPSSGDISFSIDPSLSLQIFVWNGTRPYSRPAVFDDFSGPGTIQSNATSATIDQSTIAAGDRYYYTFRVSGAGGSPYIRIWLDYEGNFSFLSWNDKAASWTVVSVPLSSCDLYASCGPFGYCDSTGAVPTCRCPDGFDPVDGRNSSKGCRRKEQLGCGKTDYFVPLPEMKVPDNFLRLGSKSLDQCEAECSRNCSCTAYAYAYLTRPGIIGGTSRCLVWAGDLLDMGKNAFAADSLHLRLAQSPAQNTINLAAILVPAIACLLLAFVAVLWRCKYRGKRQKEKFQKRMMREYLRSTDEDGDKNLVFPFISFQDIVAATDNFCHSNLLGKGGFGKVYKGILEDTKEVAIKRLSKGSGQGTEEFRNEVALIAKLQHKNLVKLLGCSIHEDEKLLVYEYLPNKSLDYFLFDQGRRPMLQWPIRCKIIQGIARGIMYLHQDSRLKIIHRDLKPSNILLDMDMSPKISDFGMARIFCGDQPQANTNRVVGTYGYMSPEYAMEGAFSVQSDIYSFGVLLLEIVSGLKISSPHLIRDFPNLIVYAWNLWKDGKAEDFVDSAIKNNCPLDEVSRCVHIGLLCVQDSPDCRPLMSAVVFMLENKTTPLPVPKQPVYFTSRNAKPEQPNEDRVVLSVNGMSLTALEGR